MSHIDMRKLTRSVERYVNFMIDKPVEDLRSW